MFWLLAEIAHEFHGPAQFVLHGFQGAPLYLAFAGVALAWFLYIKRPDLPPVIADKFAAVYKVLANKFYFDELYNIIFVRFSLWLSRASAWFDRTIINGVVDGVGRFGYWLSHASARFDSRFIDGIVNGLKVPEWPQNGWQALHRLALQTCKACAASR